jgi:hypothetical protein
MTPGAEGGKQGSTREDFAMRTRRTTILTGLAIASALALAPACNDSNNMTSPSMVVAARVAGTWTGTYESTSTNCPSAPMTLTLTQNVGDVTGTFHSSSCGPNGAFRGKVEGSRLTGAIEMLGCSGGGVSGQVSTSGLALEVGDLYRPIVSGSAVVMAGGSADLNR